MNLYNQEEVDRINKAKETNDKMEEFFNDKRAEWNKNVEPLFKVLSLDLSNPSNSKNLLEAQSIALSFRQQINEQINFFLNKRSKETTKIKKLRQEAKERDPKYAEYIDRFNELEQEVLRITQTKFEQKIS